MDKGNKTTDPLHCPGGALHQTGWEGETKGWPWAGVRVESQNELETLLILYILTALQCLDSGHSFLATLFLY